MVIFLLSTMKSFLLILLQTETFIGYSKMIQWWVIAIKMFLNVYSQDSSHRVPVCRHDSTHMHARTHTLSLSLCLSLSLSLFDLHCYGGPSPYSLTPYSVHTCSVASNSFVTPRTVACQVPLSMGFSRQEYWSGLPFPSPIEPFTYSFIWLFYQCFLRS